MVLNVSDSKIFIQKKIWKNIDIKILEEIQETLTENSF